MVQALKAKMKEQKGFTLIELLAVIVILGIIAAIAIPAIGNVINKSTTRSDAQDGVQIINAAKMYMANNDGVMGASATHTIEKTDLETYLDHVKNDTEFKVVVTKVGTSGNFSYKLIGEHPANPHSSTSDTTGISEQDLIDIANGD